jgi:hypothetical protein
VAVHDAAPTRTGGQHSSGDLHEGPISVNVPQRGDQVRWGPVWAGLVVALPTFLLGSLIFAALGVLDLGDSVSPGTAGIVTGLIGLGAFFLGGLTAAATAMWRGVNTGLLHGILVWALGVLVILFLSLQGAGALLGGLGTIASQLADPAAATAPSAAEGQSAASYAVLGLGLTFIASALGGVVGAKFWPRKKDAEATTAR